MPDLLRLTAVLVSGSVAPGGSAAPAREGAGAAPPPPAIPRPRRALGQIADGAVVRLTHPTRIGLKSSAARPGHCAVVLADGRHLVLPRTIQVAVLRQPIALEAATDGGAGGAPGGPARGPDGAGSV